MHELPDWEQGAVAVLSVRGPHSIPVSTAVRSGPDRVLLALGSRRETLARLRSDPSVALAVVAPGLAFTAVGTAGVVREAMQASPNVAVVELRVERLQDHLADGRTAIIDGVRWRWIDREAAEADAAVRSELRELAAGRGEGRSARAGTR